MNIEIVREAGNLIFECISGSRSYGLEVASSDTDFKGVYILPQAEVYSMNYVEQMSTEKNDTVFYELKRFVELLYKNNPNLLELLGVPPECILFKHPIFDLFKPELFLSKLCYSTFAKYAQAQIKVARGLNKKIMNPVDKERKSLFDFCYIIDDHGSITVKDWLQNLNYQQEYCGLVHIPHISDLYALYYDDEAHRSNGASSLGFQGIIKNGHSSAVALSSIPKGKQKRALMAFNATAYKQYCRAYKEYWEWVANRNETRYQNTISHGKNYDAKNMMHTFRLLDMAEEIALEKRIMVKSPNRDLLIQIREGKFSYDELVEKATCKLDKIKRAFEKSDLPERPDRHMINDLLVSVRTQYYNTYLLKEQLTAAELQIADQDT